MQRCALSRLCCRRFEEGGNTYRLTLTSKWKKPNFGYYCKGSFRTERGQIQFVLYNKSSV